MVRGCRTAQHNIAQHRMQRTVMVSESRCFCSSMARSSRSVPSKASSSTDFPGAPPCIVCMESHSLVPYRQYGIEPPVVSTLVAVQLGLMDSE